VMKNFKYVIGIVLAAMFVACSSHSTQPGQLSFPHGMDQPFLSWQNMLGEDLKPASGFVSRFMDKILGPKSSLQLMRPVAITFDGNDHIYVADADAGRVIKYEYDEEGLLSTSIVGEGTLTSPNGLAVWNDILYVSDAGPGRIYRFDLAGNAIDTLKIEGLIRPGQLKVSPAGDKLFIVDTPAHEVTVINISGQIMGRLKLEKSSDRMLGAPLAVDFMQDGKIVLLDGLSRRVEFFAPDYTYLNGFGGYDRVPGSFSNPRGLTISSDGYIFISDAAFGNIQIFDPKGALLYFFGTIGKEAGEFLLPASIEFDDHDNLYVMDQYNNRVQVFHYFAQEG